MSRSRTSRTPAAAVVVLVVTCALAGPVLPAAAEPIAPVAIERIRPATAADPRPGWAGADGWSTAAPADVAPFAMVGAVVDDAAEVEVRTAVGDGPWSAWTALPHLHEEGPDPDTAEARAAAEPGAHHTHPVHTGAADRVQLRSTGDVTAAELVLIDPHGLGRGWAGSVADHLRSAWRGTPSAAADALADTPAIVTRAGWGADESIVRGGPSYARDVERAFLHHTVGSNDYTAAEAPGIVRGVMAYHVRSRGWSDIGYNFLVDRYGTVYEGRAGGVDRAVIGAQAGGFNTSSTGIALMGDFSSATPPAAAVDAVADLVAWKADVHHFHPLGQSTAVSGGSSLHAEGARVQLPNLSGHRDVSSTSCPGQAAHVLLAEVRAAARERAGDLLVDPDADLSSTRVVRGDPVAPAMTVTATLDPPGDWALELVDPDGLVRGRTEGSGDRITATLPLDGTTWRTGAHRWTLSSPGRRPAVGELRLDPPAITGLDTSAVLVEVDRDGRLREPMAVHADLWPDAAWTLTVTDPQGVPVLARAGVGHAVDQQWIEGAHDPGTYTVTVTADDAAPVRRAVELRYALLDRVGDAGDPVGAAVQMSDTAFGPGQAIRAVVARHDVFADALAGGPLAGDGGPLLLTPSDRLDPRVAAELDRVLAPDAVVYVLGGPAAIEEDVADALARHGDVVRLAGDSRTATAVEVAEVVVERTGATTAMIARAGPDDAAPWADAVAGGAWGARTGVPVLLSHPESLSRDTARALRRLDVEDTIVLGGTAALGPAVEAALPAPVRLSGADRAETSAAVAAALWEREPPTGQVLIANGWADGAWAWALAAAPLAARRGAPLLLSGSEALTPAVAGWLARGGAREGALVGPPTLLAPAVDHHASAVLR